jgi:trehalose 6-phosphate phosphatase
MFNVLAADQAQVLREYAVRDVLLAFDFDGTLAPIVSDPSQAFMAASTRELMWQVSERYPVIVISGRGQWDALRRVRNMGVLEVVGNHGIAPGPAAQRFLNQVQRWRPTIDAWIAKLPGLRLETKDYSLAIHYRQVEDPVRAQQLLLELAQQLPDARAIGGRQVVSFVPVGAPDKGSALLQAQARLGCECAIYVGDDETDEDVFVRAAPGALLGIRVGQKSETAATHYIADQLQIDRLLEVLLSLRSEECYARRRSSAWPAVAASERSA